MTRQVLVSQRLPELRSGNAALDQWANQHVQRHVAEVFEQIRWLVGAQGTWTAAISGSGTAGTYEIASQACYFYRIGDLVTLYVDITLAGSVTGGGTGNINITGGPFDRDEAFAPIGTAWISGVNITDTTVHVVSAFTGATTLELHEINDNAGPAAVAISGLAANDRIIATITYPTISG